MTTPDDFFNMPEADVPRGPGGSPMLVPKGLEGKGIRVPYTRASYMADQLENKDHIHKWEMRYLAKAMGQNEDLAALAAVETYSTGISDAIEQSEKSASGRRLDEIIERALDRVRIHEKADRGTAIHGGTEPGGVPLQAVPERLRGPVQAFWDINLREGIELVATEQFTANDITMSAGTFDHLVRVPGDPVLCDYVVADKKTGRFSPFEWAIQISTYANGDPYDTSNDTRPAWPGPINLKYGLVWQIDAETSKVLLWVIDLEIGWELAQMAARVRDIHAEEKSLARRMTRTPMKFRIENVHTEEDLRTLWYATEDAHERLNIEEKARSLT